MLKKTKLLILLLPIVFSALIVTGQVVDSIPFFSVECSQESLTPGDKAVFKLTGIKSDWGGGVIFNWKVSYGEIISEQGTNEITVKLPNKAGEVTATVEIMPFPSFADNTASCKVFVKSPEPILSDEFSANTQCGDVFARLDNFTKILQNYPAATGFVVIYGEPGKTVKNFVRVMQVKNFLEMMKFDSSRVKIVKAANRQPANTEFWLIEPGAPNPEISEDPWGYDLSAVIKPFILGTYMLDGIKGCDGYNLGLYAEFLDANPGFRGNIVIREISLNKFRQIERSLLKEVGEKKVARRRLKTFFVKIKPESYQESTEFWLVSPKR